MSEERILSREEPFGGKPQKVAGRSVELKSKDFMSTEQAVPVRIFWGTVIVSGQMFTPVFQLGARKHKTEQPGK